MDDTANSVFYWKGPKWEAKNKRRHRANQRTYSRYSKSYRASQKTNLIGVANTLLLTVRRAWQTQIYFSWKCWNLEGIIEILGPWPKSMSPMTLIFRANLTSYFCWHWNLYGIMTFENLDSCYFVSPADEVVRMCISSVHVHANS